MKKGFLKLSVLFAALFIGTVGVNAAISIPLTDNCKLTNLNDQNVNMSCDLKFEITGTSTIKKGDTFRIALEEPSHIVNNEVTITPETGWEIDDASAAKTVTLSTDSEVIVTLKYTGDDDLAASTIKFAAGTYTKDDNFADNCGFKYGVLANVCDIISGEDGNTHYYDSKGKYLGFNDEAKAAYYKDCYSCKTPDEATDGKYHDKNGNVTDEAGYKKDCIGTCRQEKGEDKKWHYYDYENNEITADEFRNICQENPKSGSFIPYVGIIAGVALISVATVMVRKQTKIRKI